MAIDIGDFRIGGGRVTLRKTGNSAAIDRRLLAEVASWTLFYLALRLTSPWFPRRVPSLWFTPDTPAARYQLRQAAIAAGIRLARDPRDADAAFYFEDATTAVAPPSPLARAFNFGCADISKSRVAAAFEKAFGYPLAIDPATWVGDAVEKSERNGAHDGRVVRCPRVAEPGLVYQRLIDAIDADGMAVDLRTQCVGGRVAQVWGKRRPAAARFLPPNAHVAPMAADKAFSAAEQTAIARFCAIMRADWCALDILRDRDGRIYVVDLNKTDAGPIIALPLRDKLAAARRLGAALRELVAAPA